MTYKRCESCNHIKGHHRTGWIFIPGGIIYVLPCEDCDCKKYEYKGDKNSILAWPYTVEAKNNNVIVTFIGDKK